MPITIFKFLYKICMVVISAIIRVWLAIMETFFLGFVYFENLVEIRTFIDPVVGCLS